MALGLSLMTGLGAIPLLLLFWGLGTIVGVVFVAEALERTRGLSPTTFGGAFWLAVVFVVLLVALEIATWFPRDGKARGGCLTALLTRPTAAAVLLLLPTILLVRWDIGGTDVPDVVTTTALLFVLGYGLFVLPLAFAASGLRLARWLWRLGSGSSFRSGLVAGGTTVLGALLPTCMVCAPPDHPANRVPQVIAAAFDEGREAVGDAVEHRGLAEGMLGVLTEAADVIPGTSSPWKLPPSLWSDLQRTALKNCVTRLATSKNGRATVERAMQWLSRNKGADSDTANSVAYATVWSVCRVHALEPLADLDSYYWKAVQQNYCKAYQRNPLRECPLYDDGNYQCTAYGSAARLDVVLEFRARLCRLRESKDRDIVLRTLKGQTSKEIAGELGMTDANVRQRLKRALGRLRDD